MKCTAIVLAAGQGKRMKSKVQKQFLDIQGYPVLYYSIKCFQECEWIDDIILVTGADEVEYCRREIVEKYNFNKVSSVTVGGKERYHSVWNGLKVCSNTDYVFIHLICTIWSKFRKCIPRCWKRNNILPVNNI